MRLRRDTLHGNSLILWTLNFDGLGLSLYFFSASSQPREAGAHDGRRRNSGRVAVIGFFFVQNTRNGGLLCLHVTS
jgi:hypothetical protein